MIRFLTDRPIGVLTTCLGLMVMGLLSIFSMPSSLLPPTPVPALRVQVTAEGIDAGALHESRIRPLMDDLTTLGDLEEISSVTYENRGRIDIRFEFGTDMDLKLIEVKEKIDLFDEHSEFTDHSTRVIKADLSRMPMLMLSVTRAGSSLIRLNDVGNYCDHILKRRLEQLEEVAFADITGVPRTATEIIIDPAKLISAGLTIRELAEQLRGNNEQANVKVIDGNYCYSLVIRNSTEGGTDIGNALIRTSYGEIIPLRELAHIGLVTSQPKYFLQGRPAIGIAVLMSSSANHRSLKKNVAGIIDEIKESEPELEITFSGDRSGNISNSITGLKNNLILGTFISCLLVILFMRRIKPAIILLTSVPASLLITVLFMKLLGIGFNIVTISGLILATGLMIDNAIIVTDNILAILPSGRKLISVITKGTNEVIGPLISSQLTTCIVFLPLIFLSGTAGTIFREQAITVACGLLSSLMVSVGVVPVLFRLIYEEEELKIRKSTPVPVSLYDTFLSKALRSPQKVLLAAACIFLAGLIAFPAIPKMLYPELPGRTRLFRVTMGELYGYSASYYPKKDDFDYIFKESDRYQIYSGSQDFLCIDDMPEKSNQLLFYVDFKDRGHADQYTEICRQRLKSAFPFSSIEALPAPHPFTKIFNSERTLAEARIYGGNYKDIPSFDSLTALLRTLDQEIIKADLIETEVKPLVQLLLDPEKVNLYNTSFDEIVTAIRAHSEGLRTAIAGGYRLQEGLLRFEAHEALTIGNLPVRTSTGNFIPLDAVSQQSDTMVYDVVRSDRSGPYVPIPLGHRSPDISMREKIRDSAGQYGLEAQFEVPWMLEKSLVSPLLLSFSVSIILLYFILAVQFGSLIQPLIILSEVVIDLAGSLVFLLISGHSVNIMSCIGMIIMTGIIINDSILKIDAINRYYDSGGNLILSIIRGGRKRFRPVILTSLTTILALLPVLLSEGEGQALQRPLAAAVTGGLFTGTLVSLFFIPVVYMTHRKISRKLKNIYLLK